MANYDYGGGCPCGLYKECDCGKYQQKESSKMDEDDFGFTAVSDEELFQSDTVEEMKTKLESLRKMIMPLLNNLKANADKDYIHWPDRTKKIDAFIKKMDKIIEG